MVGVMRQEDLSGSALMGEAEVVTHSAQWTRNPEHNSVRFGTGSPIGRSLSPLSTGPARYGKKSHHLSISAGLSEFSGSVFVFLSQ